MIYQQAIDYIHNNTWQGSHLGLERTEELLERLGNPHHKLKFVHIAGTNGKGSTAAMLSSVLMKAGYKTGLNTSPYLYKFNERIQVDGVSIADDEIAELVDTIRVEADKMDEPPTEFELVTCLSFCYFLQKKCDIVVLEVGLGGRMDSTNVIKTNEVAIVTTIGLDHIDILGDTVEKIATEKAGIIKDGSDVIISLQDENVIDTVKEIATSKNANLTVADYRKITQLDFTVAGQNFDSEDFKGLHIPLVGTHQLQNVGTVLEAIKVLAKKGYNISEQAIRQGLSQTVWPGRFELLQSKPTFIVDGGHNPQCAGTVFKTLKDLYPDKKILFLVGLLGDKDFEGVIGTVAGIAKEFVTVMPNSPRALTALELKEKITTAYKGMSVTACDTVTDGVAKVLSLASSDDVICAFGSLYMVGEIRQQFVEEMK